MARSRRKRRGNSGGSITTIALLSAVIIGLGATYGFFKYKASQRVALDPETLCPVTGPVASTAVLLDLSDPVARPTLQNIVNELAKLIPAIPQGGQLVVYALTETASTIEQKFGGCSPGDGSAVDPIIANPRQAQEQWELGWRKPLDAFIESIDNTVSGSRSPIMAGIQQADLQLFHASSAPTGPKSLVIISDMVEHTDAFSMFKSGADFAVFEKSPARRMFAADLRDINVTLLLVRRLKSPVKENDLLAFWTAWFAENGVGDRQMRVVPLAGAT